MEETEETVGGAFRVREGLHFDTVKLVSGVLEERERARIEKQLDRIIRVSANGDVVWRVSRSELRGTWEARAGIYIDGRGRLVVEFSPKVVAGHNVGVGFCGIGEFKQVADMLLADVYSGDMRICRLDVAVNYRVAGDVDVSEWLRDRSHIEYSRRRSTVYEGTLYYPSQERGLKVYDKEREVKVHDRGRLAAVGRYEEVVSRARGIVRVEVEHRAKWFDRKGYTWWLGKGEWEVWERVMEASYDEVLEKWRRGDDAMMWVREQEAVRERLLAVYGGSLGRAVLGTWVMVQVYGYERARESVARSTFYRHIGMMRRAGVAVYGEVTVRDLKWDVEVVRVEPALGCGVGLVS